jgi:hypothetical protein
MGRKVHPVYFQYGLNSTPRCGTQKGRTTRTICSRDLKVREIYIPRLNWLRSKTVVEIPADPANRQEYRYTRPGIVIGKKRAGCRSCVKANQA